jgi:hypothetical protein
VLKGAPVESNTTGINSANLSHLYTQRTNISPRHTHAISDTFGREDLTKGRSGLDHCLTLGVDQIY